MSVIELGYKRVLRPWLFQMSKGDPEGAHEIALKLLETVGHSSMLMWFVGTLLVYRHPMLEQIFWGLPFHSPLGRAPGFDKNGRVVHVTSYLGWTHDGIGGVLHDDQPGNPRPRVWYSEELLALCNWLGFNSQGMEATMANLKRHTPLIQGLRIPRILNIGKNRDASEEQAIHDYPAVLSKLWDWVDIIEANPSSPNTPGHRDLQKKDVLKELLLGLQKANQESARARELPEKPLGVKISPDESDEALQDMIDVAVELGIQFLSLTNTTVSREGTQGWDIPPDRGGVSGPPLTMPALRVLKEVHSELKQRGVRNQFVLNGVGGIYDAHTLFERILNGANICSALTVWPFEGPDWPKRTNKQLVRLLRSNGFNHVREAVGAAA